MDKYEQRKKVAEWLNKQGYELELDKDGLWMEDYDFTEHKTKDVIDLILEWAGNQTNSKPANCAIFDVSAMLPEIIVSLNNGEKIKAIKCSECDYYFEEKEIQIQGDLDTCDDCLCPEQAIFANGQ